MARESHEKLSQYVLKLVYKGQWQYTSIDLCFVLDCDLFEQKNVCNSVFGCMNILMSLYIYI